MVEITNTNDVYSMTSTAMINGTGPGGRNGRMPTFVYLTDLDAWYIRLPEDTTTTADGGLVITDASGGRWLKVADGLFAEHMQRQRTLFFDDFLGDALKDELQATAGGGTGNGVAVSAGPGGRVAITTASDDGAITANASALALGALDWRADQGGLTIEARLQIDDISEAYVFVGFTDVLPGSTLEAPVFLSAANIDSDASNACGVFYDVDGTTEEWCHGGVKADADTTPAYSGAAPTEGAYQTIRLEVSEDGAVQGFIDGTAIGDAVADAVTASTPLCPVIVVANRSANQVVALVDYILVQANR